MRIKSIQTRETEVFGELEKLGVVRYAPAQLVNVCLCYESKIWRITSELPDFVDIKDEGQSAAELAKSIAMAHAVVTAETLINKANG